MTFYYRTTTAGEKPGEATKAYWKAASEKKNWRITQLPNGYFQSEVNFEDKWHDITRRETLEGAEAAIDASVEHFQKKLGFIEGPKIIKTFE